MHFLTKKSEHLQSKQTNGTAQREKSTLPHLWFQRHSNTGRAECPHCDGEEKRKPVFIIPDSSFLSV